MIEWFVTISSLIRELRRKAGDALARIEAKDEGAAKLVNGYMKTDYQAVYRLWEEQGFFRVEPAVTQPAPSQTRTGAMNASGSSVTRVAARLWRSPVLPCMARQMWWTILGRGRIEVRLSFSNVSHCSAL
jgi:hypothetical protein